MTGNERYAAIGLLVGAGLLLYLLSDILSPFLIGIAIAYLGDPLVDRMEELGLSRTVAVTLVFVVLTTVMVGVVLIVLPLLVGEVSALIQQLPALLAWLQQTGSPLLTETFGVDPFDFDPNELRKNLADNWHQAGNVAGVVLREVSHSGLALMALLANAVLIPVVAFYLMRDWDEVMARLRALLPRGKERYFVGLVAECDDVLSAFLRGQLFIMLLLGVVYAVGLLIVGLDLALLIGLLAGLASMVPYLGFIVGFGAAAIAALFQFGDVFVLVWVLVVFGVGQALEGMVLTPLLVGDRIGLHPVAVIFAIMAGSHLFGLVGVLLALPVGAVIMVFVRHLHGRYLDSRYYESRTERSGILPDDEAE